MMLLLDIGNSRVKWATLQDGVMGAVAAVTHRDAVLDELWPNLWHTLSAPRRVVVANVAGPDLAQSLSSWCRGQWGVDAEYVAANAISAGIRNGYTSPARLGVDRWLAMIGAATLAEPPYCVADSGTALTVDAVDVGGNHLGGWIVPGQVMMGALLRGGTSAVQVEHAAGEVVRGFGRNTNAAVSGGALYAGAGLVRAALDLLEQHSGRPATCIITGGDAPAMLPLLPTGCTHRPELVLLGLAVWVKEESKGISG